MTRITPQIVRSTPKAHLIAYEGRQGWIQARWLKADGTVSAATFERAVASAAERQASRERKTEYEAAERIFRDGLHLIQIVRQTEKAIAAAVTLHVPGGFEDEAMVWFPKSRCEPGEVDGTAFVAGWMIREREASAADSYSPSGRGYYERHRFCKGERAELARGVEVLATAI